MKLRLAALVGAAWLVASPAFGVTLIVTSGGLTGSNANYGCPAGSANCLTSEDFVLANPAAASGTISTNATGSLATLSLDVPSALFNPKSGTGPAEAFTNLHYTATVSVSTSSSVITEIPPGGGNVVGNVNGSPFTSGSAVLNLNCLIIGSTGQCGLAYGPMTYTADSHNWLNTFSLIVRVPEPASCGLLALGLAVLGLARRR